MYEFCCQFVIPLFGNVSNLTNRNGNQFLLNEGYQTNYQMYYSNNKTMRVCIKLLTLVGTVQAAMRILMKKIKH